MKRLIRNICVLVLLLIIPVSWVLINDYVDRPFVDAIGSGVILEGFRLLETVIGLAIMFGLCKLIEKSDSGGARAWVKRGTIERGRWLAQFCHNIYCLFRMISEGKLGMDFLSAIFQKAKAA